MSYFFLAPAYLIAAWPYAGILNAVVMIGLQAGLSACAAGRSTGESAGDERRGFGLNFFREPLVFVGLLWLIYGFYERQMAAIVNLKASVVLAGSGAGTGAGAGASMANLSLGSRFDLIILVPILYVMTAAALYSLYRQLKR
jgi:hypothetical protein